MRFESEREQGQPHNHNQGLKERNTYNNSVVPGKNGKLMKSSDQIPPSCDVAGYEDAKGQNGERGHEAALLLDHGIMFRRANNGALVSRNGTAQDGRRTSKGCWFLLVVGAGAMRSAEGDSDQRSN